MNNADKRYDTIAIVLHWLIAVAILGMLTSGVIMTSIEMEKMQKFQLFQWHKSSGVLLLWAVIARLIWRLTHTPPALPSQFSSRDIRLARMGHWALYAWMLLLPLSGWAMVSSSVYGLPTIVFGWFEWPHLPFLENNAQAHEASETTHAILAYSMFALVAVHIAAVIKHAMVDGENLLKRMTPWGKG